MPINNYTREIIQSRQTPRLNDPNAVQNASAGFRAIADVTGQVGANLEAKQREKTNREEVIQRARAVSEFKEQGQNDFVEFSQANDMTDPNAVREFNTMIRQKQADFLAQHGGGDESRARLETQLIGLGDTFSSKMTEVGYNAQKQFITNTVGEHVSRIQSEVYQNPENIEVAFAQLNGLFDEYGSALDSVSEMGMIEAAQSQVMEGAINSFVDVGDYEKARDLIDQNPMFVESMSPNAQRSVLTRIHSGLQAQEEQRNKTANEITRIKSAADTLGVEIAPEKIFGAVTGISQSDSPQDRVDSFAQTAGLSPEQLTPEVVAKIGYGVDLPSSSDIDMNKERTPDGGYTPKGIGAVVKPAYDTAANTKIQVDKVLMQAESFLENDNKQAGLASMIAFQKLIDDGAAVREGDIKLSAQGNSSLDNIQLMLKKIGEGGIATPSQIHEMKESAKIFGQAVLEASKTQIDPYLQEAQEKGYRMLDIGLPQQSYDRVFGNTKTKEDSQQLNSSVEAKAKQAGMSVQQYFEATAQRHNISVDEVAKKLGYTGVIGE